MMSDEMQLITRCQQGEAAAWNELFDRHYGPMGCLIMQLLPDASREDAKEICQEVFLSVIKHLHSFNRKSRLQTWIFRIAVNKASDYRKTQCAVKRGGGQAVFSLQAEDPQTGLKLDLPSSAESPADALIHSETLALVGRALAQLNESCREIIELRYFGELSYLEIAGVLNLNPKTVGSRLNKALSRFAVVWRRMGRLDQAPSYPLAYPATAMN